jgi:hypothetical protein
MARETGFEPACIQLAFSGLEDQRHTHANYATFANAFAIAR